MLTDIKMPGMDGIALLKEIRKNGWDIKTIILSGYNDFSLVRQTMKCGAVGYLLKPVGKNELIQLIEELLDQLESLEDTEGCGGDGAEVARSNFYNRLITSNVNALEFREKSEFLDVDFGKDQLAVGKLGGRNRTSDEEGMRLLRNKIVDACREYLQGRKIGTAFLNIAGDIVFLFYGIRNHRKDDIYKKELG